MAGKGERFLFWRDYYNAMELLDDKQCGEYVRGLCQIAFDGIEPTTDDPVVRMAWAMVAGAVRESVDIGRKSAEAGAAGGRKSAEKRAGKKASRGPSTTPSRGGSRGPSRGGSSVRLGKVTSVTTLSNLSSPVAGGAGARLEGAPRTGSNPAGMPDDEYAELLAFEPEAE